LGVVAHLWPDEAEITAGQAAKAREAIPLLKTLGGFPAARNTVDLTEKLDTHGLPDKRVEGEELFPYRQSVSDRGLRRRDHLA
jgi:hypothetical protein